MTSYSHDLALWGSSSSLVLFSQKNRDRRMLLNLPIKSTKGLILVILVINHSLKVIDQPKDMFDQRDLEGPKGGLPAVSVTRRDLFS